MQITYTISRAELKAKSFKSAREKRSGEAPKNRDTTLLLRVLKQLK